LDPDNVPAAEDVIKTNSFQVDIGGKGYMALFPEIAVSGLLNRAGASKVHNGQSLTIRSTATDVAPHRE
jgi:hypothetical protein